MFFIVLSIYFSAMTLILGMVNVLMILIFFEVLSWIFVVVVPGTSILSYLLVQSGFFFLSITLMVWDPLLLVVPFLVKLGLPPFYIWYLRVAEVLTKLPFIFMSTLHKLAPIFFFCKMTGSSFNLLAMMSVMLLVSLLLVGSNTIINTLVFSSMAHTMWMLLSGQISKGFILLYWMGYTAVLLILLSESSNTKLKLLIFNETFIMSMCWLLLSGTPPFLFFWLKTHVVMGVILSMSVFVAIMLFITSVIPLSAYYRSWYFGVFLTSQAFYSGQKGILIYTILFWFMLS